MGKCVIFFFRQQVEPLHAGLIRIGIGCQVGKTAAGNGPVPMLYTWRALGHVSWTQNLYRLAFNLVIAYAIGNDENLPASYFFRNSEGVMP